MESLDAKNLITEAVRRDNMAGLLAEIHEKWSKHSTLAEEIDSLKLRYVLRFSLLAVVAQV